MSRPQLAVKPRPSVAKDAKTDAAMGRILFEFAELCSSFREWKRAAWALDDRLARPELAQHPKRPAAVERWNKAVDRCARIELGLWDLAPAAAASWLAYSPVRREALARSGVWPAVDCSLEGATDWFRGHWLYLAWKGALKT